MSNELIVVWDLPDDPQGNVQHIAQHGLTVDDVEDVLYSRDSVTSFSRSSGQPITFGYTTGGEHIAVVWELVAADPRTIYPITAYAVPEARD
ncbi:MAG: hypothetical protein K2Y37_03130 [Pirellulales bacterium]|nr:hypothetical protein [Pirellulales bacterium]